MRKWSWRYLSSDEAPGGVDGESRAGCRIEGGDYDLEMITASYERAKDPPSKARLEGEALAQWVTDALNEKEAREELASKAEEIRQSLPFPEVVEPFR